jgi:hypothetical protein
MRRARHAHRIAGIACAVSLCGAACGRSAAPARPAVDAAAPEAWTTGICGAGDGWCWGFPRPTGAKLNRLWGTSAEDVWAVGEGGTIIHFDGARWAQVPSGTTDALVAIGGRGPGDAWAIGSRRTVLRLSGSTWRAAEMPKLDDEPTFADLLVLPNGEAWIVGGATKKSLAGDEIISHCLIGHTDAGADANWKFDDDGACGPLGRVWGASPDDVWADGGDDVVHWNGRYLTRNPKQKPAAIVGRHGYASGWKLALDWGSGGMGTLVHPSPKIEDPGAARDFWAWSGDEVWAISKDGALRHFDGKGWSRGDDPVYLRAVAARAADDIWAIAQESAVLHFDGRVWRSSRLPGAATQYPVAIAAPTAPSQGADEVWVLTARELLRFDGTRWTTVVAKSQWTLSSFLVRAPNDIWIGAGSKLLHWNGETAETIDVDFNASHVFGDARELWAGWPLHRWDGSKMVIPPETAGKDGKGMVFSSGALGGGALWLVGEKRISRLAGGRLDTVKDLSARLDAIWASAAGEIWAAGTHLVHGRGETWTSEARPGGADFTSIGGGDGVVWALSRDGLLVRR